MNARFVRSGIGGGLVLLGALCGVGSGVGAQELGVGTEIGARGGQGGASVDGRFALRDAFVFDNQDFNVHLIFFDADLGVKRFAQVGSGHLNFKLDSRFMLDLTQDQDVSTSQFTGAEVKTNERRFGVTQTPADVRQLYIELEDLGSVDVQAGRVWLHQAGGAWADGANLVYHFNNRWSSGLFGGLQPDPFDYLPNADRQTAGLYADFLGERTSFSSAYTLQLLDGGLDRHFLFSRGHWSVPMGDFTKSLFLSYFASVDLPNSEIGLDNPVVTTFFTNASWWVTGNLNFSANYARFATSRLKDPKQQGFAAEPNQEALLGKLVAQGPYDQFRLSAVQRFDHYHVYQQIDFRTRERLDTEDAIYYLAGVRDNSFLGTDLALHGRVTVRNNFLSDSTEFLLESSYRFGGSLQLDAAAAFLTGTSEVALQDQDVIFTSARVSVDFTPDFYLALEYELTAETNIQQEELETAGDLLVHTIFSRLTYRL